MNVRLTRARRLGVDADHRHYKWWALSCTSLGMLLATINSGTLIIALPDLERSLGTSLLQLVWVILAYMIASTVLVLTAGRLSDLFGRKKAYVGGFVVFALASLGAGFSGSGTELILWRIVQGVGGAFLFANSGALVTDAFPREQLGVAMGTNTMVAATGLVLGPVLGGALVELSWHWVFWFNVPFALAGALWGGLVLRELAKPDSVRGLDIPGTLTFIAGLTGLVLGISKGGLSGWDDPVVIGGLIAAAVLLPAFVLIEHRGRAPMLDLTIFEDRLFAAATAAAFINGLSRFALLFVFVFYFQGAQGDDPITAGIKLAPLAIGMLVSSPLAGLAADKHGSRGAGRLGHGRLGRRPGADDDPAGRQPLLAEQPLAADRRRRLWPVQLAQHRRDDGRRARSAARHRRRRPDDGPEHRRGRVDRLRAGNRDRRHPAGRALQDLLRPRQRAHRRPARAVHPQHARGAARARADIARRRGRFPPAPEPHCGTTRVRRGDDMSLRIGEVAELTGTTPRTIRYYEELGLLAPERGREPGTHRVYDQADVERLQEVLRLRRVLGLSLEELKEVAAEESARAARLREWHDGVEDPVRRREIVEAGLDYVERQAELVRRRREELDELDRELTAKRRRLRGRLRELQPLAGSERA